MTRLLLALTFFCTSACASDAIGVAPGTAWARATPPGAKTTAIYLTVMNHGASGVKLIGAVSELSDRAELHTHRSEDGMMKMQQIESITVAANSTAELKPHGDHIMVFNLESGLAEGDTVEVRLNFDDGSELSIKIPVYKNGPNTNMQHAAGHDHHTKKKDMPENHSKHKSH